MDNNYVNSLEQYDILYSWGVFHHAGEMWQALASVERLVENGGCLFIAIYNDQGELHWTKFKLTYNKLPD